jgi:hypothetical protein
MAHEAILSPSLWLPHYDGRAGCSLDVGVTGQLLCRRDVRTGIEQIGDERVP